MDGLGDFKDLWTDVYSGLYPSMSTNGDDMGSGDTRYGAYPSLPMGPADVGLAHPTPIDFLHATYFSNAGSYSSAQNLDMMYIPPSHTPISQRQQANSQLHINTQLPYRDQIRDSQSSTTSTSSFPTVLQTPYSHIYPEPQPSVFNSPPPGSTDGRIMLIPEPEKLSPYPASPLSPYSPSFEGDIPELLSPLPTDIDVVTQVQMPHIVEWKRVIERCGMNGFIPQTVYQPYTEADRKRYIRDVELRETIFFQSEDSIELGISLEDALKQRLRRLNDKDDLMFVGCGPSVSIRIQWPGYAPWSKQIPTMDFRTPKRNITRAKLAKNIATCVRRFAEEVQDKPMEAESDIRWKIGTGNRHIKVEDLILVSLHHVSKGSWQPQLRLRPSITAISYPWGESLSSILDS